MIVQIVWKGWLARVASLLQPKKKKAWAQWKNYNGSKKWGGSEPVNSNLHGGFVHEIAHSEVEDPRQHDSEHLSGCDNPEVRWGKVMTFAHIWSWLKD